MRSRLCPVLSRFFRVLQELPDVRATAQAFCFHHPHFDGIMPILDGRTGSGALTINSTGPWQLIDPAIEIDTFINW